MSTGPLTLVRKVRGPLLVASGLLLLSGAAVVHGLWTDRWSDAGDLETTLTRMDQAPLTFGAWTGHEEKLDPDQAEQAERVGIARTMRRQYVQRPGNESVSVILMGGRFGPLCVHTPDVCYGAAGFVMAGKQTHLEVRCEDGSTAVFWTARFHKPNAPGTAPLRIFWGWNAGGGWTAPDNPRLVFRRKPVLYKLYVAREMSSLNEPLDRDSGVAFLRSWLSNLDRVLFPE